ncbi:MAG TPA: LLM class flavin-dependent oxidoreductase [Candidatus Binataceae bacterium]|nr:LLM class flavin-dependent oxidoreductase [Candidatus Binataceae bacterium]
MMRLGITLPLDGFQNSHLPELARYAERHGFTDGWSYETFESEAIVPLAATAAATERMRLGTAIIAVFTRPPALIALTAASLQRVSGGRFVLGLGISTNTIVQQWMGIPFEHPLTRVRETVAAVRAAFTGEKVTMDGKTIKINGFRMASRVDPAPPIYLGAQGTRMLRLAGEIGDGAIVNYITPETFPKIIHHIYDGARASGRPDANIDIVCRMLVAVDQEEEIVRERLRRELTAYVTVPQYNQYFREIGYENEAAVAFDAWNSGDRKRALQSIPDSMIDAIYIHGTPEKWVARLRDYEKAGITTSTLQIQSFAKSPEERRKRVLSAIEAVAGGWQR